MFCALLADFAELMKIGKVSVDLGDLDLNFGDFTFEFLDENIVFLSDSDNRRDQLLNFHHFAERSLRFCVDFIVSSDELSLEIDD